MRTIVLCHSDADGVPQYKCSRCERHGPHDAVPHLFWCDRIDELERYVSILKAEVSRLSAPRPDHVDVAAPSRGMEG